MKCPKCDGTLVEIEIPGMSRTLLELETRTVTATGRCYDCSDTFEVVMWITVELEE